MRSFCTPYLQILLLGLATSLFSQVTILENTSKKLVFTFETKDVVVSDLNGTAVSLSFKNQNTQCGLKDEPLLPGYAFQIGAPSGLNLPAISLEPLEIGTQQLSAPLVKSKGIDAVWNPSFTGSYLSWARSTSMRGLRVMQYVIKPFLYDSSSSKVTVLHRATITITFPDAPGTVLQDAQTSEWEKARASLLLNASIAVRWIPPRSMLRKTTAASFPLTRTKPLIHFTIGDGIGNFNETTTNENGILKITAAQCTGLGTIPLGSLALFASVKAELPTHIPNPNAIPQGSIQIPLVKYDLDNNGFFDNNDYCLTPVTGICDWYWNKDTLGASWKFGLNRLETSRHYWITTLAQSLVNSSEIQASHSIVSDTITSVPQYVEFKQATNLPTDPASSGDTYFSVPGGIDYIWNRLTPKASDFTIQLPLDNIIPTKPGFIQVNTYEGRNEQLSLTFAGKYFGSSIPLNMPIPVMSFSSGTASSFYAKLALHNANASYFDIDNIIVSYTMNLSLQNRDVLLILSPATPGFTTYKISGLTNANVVVLRSTYDEQGTTVMNVSFSSNNTELFFSDSTGKGYKYCIANLANMQSVPSSAELIPAASNSGQLIIDPFDPITCNYLIITHSLFKEAALALAAHKQKWATFANPTPKVIDVADIYRNFSGGNLDPSAIRNFLSYALNTWKELDYVVLMGNGNFDPKNILKKNEPTFIPVYEAQDKTCLENYFAWLDTVSSNSQIPSLILGRIPVQSAEEATGYVQKVREMEDPAFADYSAWRNRILLVADDDMQGPSVDPILDHFYSSEQISIKVSQSAPSVDIKKVYLFEYPRNQFFEKPEASRALINDINDNVSCVNWFGHGADVLWADEHILRTSTLGSLKNAGHYPLVSSFSCSVGRFDAPDESCLSDALVRQAASGAIAAISATRVSYAGSNTTLAVNYYGSLFDSTTTTSFGKAFLIAMSYPSADNKYCYLGDPSIAPAAPSFSVNLSLRDTQGVSLDTVKALQNIRIGGTITPTRTGNGIFSSGAQPASVQINIFNPDKISLRKDGLSTSNPQYAMSGALLYSGIVPVTNNSFNQTIRVPRNVAFDKSGAKITAFVYRNDALINASGALPIFFYGSDTGVSADTNGPSISVRPVYYDKKRNAQVSFSNKLTTATPGEIEILLSDSSGIDASGDGPGEGIMVEIPQFMEKHNVKNNFKFTNGNYRMGSVVISLKKDEIPPGDYSMLITARDLLGHTSNATITMTISPEQNFSLSRVFNYPNPMRVHQSTRFFFYGTTASLDNGVSELDATIKIYALSGKLLRVFKNATNGEVWDGTDQYGNQLGPNIYLYRITSTSRNPVTNELQSDKSPITKLVIQAPKR